MIERHLAISLVTRQLALNSAARKLFTSCTQIPPVGVLHKCKLVTLFGGYSYDEVSAVKGVQHTEVPNQGASW